MAPDSEEEDGYPDGDLDDDVPQLDNEETLTIDDDSGLDESQTYEYGNGNSNGNVYLALEASEADSDVSSRAGFDAYSDNTALDTSFPRFMELPPEVREMIWKEFCPDLQPTPRVFEFVCYHLREMILSSEVHGQIAPMRAVLAVHHESRALALKASPDRIELPHGNGVVPYHKNRDIIFIVSVPPDTSGAREALVLAADMAPGFQQLALEVEAGPVLEDVLEVLPGLQNLFVFVDHHQVQTRHLTWCISEAVHEYRTEVTQENEYGLQDYTDVVFCFPDTAAYADPGGEESPDRHSDALEFDQTGDSESTDGQQALEDDAPPGDVLPWGYTYFEGDLFLFCITPGTQRRWPERRQLQDEHAEDGRMQRHGTPAQHIPRVWPMVRFMFDSGAERFAKMKAWQQPWDDWDSVFGEPESPYDEYESEGIDDDPIDDGFPTDEEDDLPAHLLDEDAAFGSTAPAQAQFSSDSEVSDQNDDISPAGGEEALRNRAARLQRQALESDSEDDSNVDADKTHRPPNRRRRVVSDESDDDHSNDGQETGPAAVRAGQKRSRVVLLDSEDEDDLHPVQSSDRRSEEGSRPSRPANRRVRPSIPSDSEDEEDEAPQPGAEAGGESSSSDEDEESSDDESSDEDPPPPKRVSLAKRLQMEYQQSRSGRRAAGSSDEERYGSGGVSDDEEDDASDGTGMMMSMAEAGVEDEDEEDEDDEEGW